MKLVGLDKIYWHCRDETGREEMNKFFSMLHQYSSSSMHVTSYSSRDIVMHTLLSINDICLLKNIILCCIITSCQ